MRPIKFRGRVPDSDKLDGGKIVFGSLVDYGAPPNNRYSTCPRFWIHPPDGDGDRNFPVEPDSVAQLVGYDANGTEVYEDDTVIGDDGAEWIVGLTSCVTSDEGKDWLKCVLSNATAISCRTTATEF